MRTYIHLCVYSINLHAVTLTKAQIILAIVDISFLYINMYLYFQINL